MTILELASRNIPQVLVNARMSDRSFRRWRKNKSLSFPLFNRLRLVLAQNAMLARRFQLLGSPIQFKEQVRENVVVISGDEYTPFTIAFDGVRVDVLRRVLRALRFPAD